MKETEHRSHNQSNGRPHCPVGSGKIFILKKSRHLFPVAVQSHPSCQSSKVKEKDIEDLGMHGRPF